MNAQANTGRLSDEARHTDNSVDEWLSGSHSPGSTWHWTP